MSKSFNIQETVNKNIERTQFPSFANHRSLVGWCTMNYPKVLNNPIYLSKPAQEPPLQLHSLFQQKNPHQRLKPQFIRPFSQSQAPKMSSMTLTTTSHEMRAKIFAENNKKAQQYAPVLPLTNVLGANNDKNFDRKVRQIGEVYYNPTNEGELMRHLKKLPNTVINEHNLLEILDKQLQYLDIQYKTDISNDLINKIGYLAPNIRELVLTAVPITNEVLIQLGISCKQLQAVEISHCPLLDESSTIRFISTRKGTLNKFAANHNAAAITDATLEALSACPHLQHLSINYCREVTAMGVETLHKHRFITLGLSSLPHLKGEDFSRMLCADTLTKLDLSFNPQKEVNNLLLVQVGMCTRLECLVLTGCESISDEGMNNLIYGDKLKGKNPEGFASLHTLKLGGLRSVSDQLYQLCKRCPTLLHLEANNLERLTDHFVDQIKTHPTLKVLMINFTPNITEEKLKEIRESMKGLNVIRNIVKMTDPADDGLRMPIPPASLKVKKPKKKKK